MNAPHDELEAPHDVGAEQSVLGALMIRPESLPMVADWLSEKAFFVDAHRVLFRAIVELSDKGVVCDPVTINDWLRANGLEDLVGGRGYALEISNNTPSAANIVAYAEIVAAKAQLRELMDLGSRIVTAAGKPGADAALVAGGATQKLGTMQAARLRGGLVPAKAGVKTWFAELFERYERSEVVTGLATPWEALNKLTHGFQNAELGILAGRPNMGKSVFGDTLGIHAAMLCSAQRRGQTLLFALETSKEKVIRRAVSRMATVPHDWLVAPTKGSDDEAWWPRITSATATLTDARLQIDDSAGLTVHQIVARARRAHLQKPVRFVVIDHLHKVRIAGKNIAFEIGEVTSALKELAKELNCHVLALAQLNRNLTGRNDRRPTMADLRNSGDIEQDADLIMFIHREDYYDPNTHLQGVVEMELAKGRDVKTGAKVYFRNEYDYMRVADWEGELPREPAPERPLRSAGGSGWKNRSNTKGKDAANAD